MTTRVLIVDDSVLVRQVLSNTLVQDGDIEVAGVARDAAAARKLIRELSPDVLTLDIEMPDMNGLAFLDRLMRLRPMPVVMVSTQTQRGAGATLLALELGAVDFVAKPDTTLDGDIAAWGAALREKVRIAAATRVRVRSEAEPAAARKIASALGPAGAVVAIGASTGGVEAIRTVLAEMPADCPPVVIAQHMPAGFTARFAARLDEFSALTVREAEEGTALLPGHAYVARGDRHLRIARKGSRLLCRLGEDPAISGHRPSVDALFGSVAETAGAQAVGVILTGMGRDGTAGLLRMRAAGAVTLGENEASALVYGMPRAAYEAGAVSEQLPLVAIPARIAAALGALSRAA